VAGFTECLYEILQACGDLVACLLEPQTLAAGVTNTPTVDMSTYGRVLFLILGGAANDATATLDAVMQQCTQANDAGTDAKVLAGVRGTKAIAQVTSGAGFATLNQLWLLECRAAEMDTNNAFAFLRLQITVSAGDTWFLGVAPLRDVAAYEPVANTLVTEIVD